MRLLAGDEVIDEFTSYTALHYGLDPVAFDRLSRYRNRGATPYGLTCVLAEIAVAVVYGSGSLSGSCPKAASTKSRQMRRRRGEQDDRVTLTRQQPAMGSLHLASQRFGYQL